MVEPVIAASLSPPNSNLKVEFKKPLSIKKKKKKTTAKISIHVNTSSAINNKTNDSNKPIVLDKSPIMNGSVFSGAGISQDATSAATAIGYDKISDQSLDKMEKDLMVDSDSEMSEYEYCQ